MGEDDSQRANQHLVQVEDSSEGMTASAWSQNEPKPHPETEAILRQVEYYFSDENLPHDAHLLARTGGDGNGPTSINEILGFKKMRKFKPRAQVKAALRLSKVLEVVNSKQIKRRYPLTVPLTVQPKLSAGCQTTDLYVQEALTEKPWMTKAMLQPTGFEEYATEGPITPKEYEEDRRLYDPEESFVSRIETAVNRYLGKRKMHSLVHNVFVKFLKFGGFAADPRQFGGGFDEKALTNFDKEQKAQIISGFEVSDMVVDGIDRDDGDGSTVWSVDFVNTAKAFLSSRILAVVDWNEEENVKTAVNVLRNFYNFLLLHDVCPEYGNQILEARKYCDIAEEELPRLGRLDRMLPSHFNTACSILFTPKLPAALQYRPDEAAWKPDESIMTVTEAAKIFSVGRLAYGKPGQTEEGKHENPSPQVIRRETVGVEVTGIQYFPNHTEEDGDREVFLTIIRPMGRLVCKRWEVPHARPQDLPPNVVEARKARMTETLEFVINEEALKLCTVGVKMEVVMKTLDLGIHWIDSILAVYPTFFTWISNERVEDWKEAGPPTEGMKHRNAAKQALQQAEFTTTESVVPRDGAIARAE